MTIYANFDGDEARDELPEALDALRARGTTPRKSGKNGWTARCPTHDDKAASLSLTEGENGRLVMHCHAGCAFTDIKSALGIPDRKPPGVPDLPTHPPRRRPLAPKPSAPAPLKLVATYPYTDEHGEVLYEALRYEPKTFRQRRPNAQGGWVSSLGDVRRVLYRLPAVLAASADSGTVYIAEGEKDVEAIESGGEVATCSPMGAGKWRDEFADALKGCACVVVIADKDTPGVKHAHAIAKSLLERDIPHVIRQALTGKDAADHIEAGHALDELVDYEPTDEPETLESEPDEAQVTDDAEAIPSARSHVEILDLDELLANPPPDPEYAWGGQQGSGYIERGTLAVLHGDGGLGKSLIGMGLCRRYALKREWLGQDTLGGIPLYLDGENSLAEIARRLYAFEVRPGEQTLKYGRVDMPVLNNPDVGEALLESLIEETGATLLVIDSQRALWGGDEREQLEVRPMYAMLARVAERLQVAILLIHHDNKSGLYSGSTDINAAVVSRLHLERRNPKNKKDRRRTLWQEKSRSGPEADPVTFSVDKGHDGILTFAIHEDDDADEMPPSKTPIPRDTIGDRVLALLADRVPRKRFEVARELGIDASNGTLRRAWETLINDTSIVATAPGTYTLS